MRSLGRLCGRQTILQARPTIRHFLPVLEHLEDRLTPANIFEYYWEGSVDTNFANGNNWWSNNSGLPDGFVYHLGDPGFKIQRDPVLSSDWSANGSLPYTVETDAGFDGHTFQSV